LVASQLGVFVFAAACVGLALAWAYSAPPFRLKTNGWWGNTAVAACYEGLPWLTGAAVMTGAAPSARVFIVAALYSLGAHGIMTLNDFKSIEGDKRSGIASLPVQLGAERAGRVACWVMALPQVVVIALLVSWGYPIHAAVVAIVLLVQLRLMMRLLESPKERAPWYNGTGVTLYVLGMLVTAFALGSSPAGAA
jgi:chlorophyll synthase